MTDMIPSSLEDEEIRDYDMLLDKTKKLKLKSENEMSVGSSHTEAADEFLRNFFLKFGMTKTLESFQIEFYEKKANGETMEAEIPEVYARNLELSDQLASLQQQMDEARIISEKAKSTYDKLIKQKDYQKINHRRVQQEKAKLNKQMNQLKKVYETNQYKFKELTQKYENVRKEKSFAQVQERSLEEPIAAAAAAAANADKTQFKSKLEDTQVNTKKKKKFQSGIPAEIPLTDPENPAHNEMPEIMNASLTLQKTFKGHLMGVTGLSYNASKHILATASDDSTWKLWSIPNGELIMSGEGHQDWLGGCCFHPTNQFIATCSGDGEVKIWDIINACCAVTFREHPQAAWNVDYHHTGDFLLSSSMDHTIKLWDMNVPKSRFTFRGHVDSVNSVQFQPYSCMFASGAADKTISIWDIRTNICVQTFYGHNNAVNSVSFNPKGDMIASTDSDGIVKVWDVRMVKENAEFDTGMASANCAAFDPSGEMLVIGSEDGTIKLQNIVSGEREDELKASDSDSINCVVVDNSKEGAMIISASSDCTFRIWQ